MRRKIVTLLLIGLAMVGRVDAQTRATLAVEGGRIEISFSDACPAEFQNLARNWIISSAHAVANYYEHFPVHRLALQIRIFDGHGVRAGQTFGWNGAEIKISVGNATTAAEFADDWMLTHEMIHLAFPSV